MSDFETHKVGTARELKLLRDIASEIYLMPKEDYAKLPLRSRLIFEAYLKHIEQAAIAP